MLADDRLDALFADAPRIGDALARLRDAMPVAHRYELFYGLFVHEDGLLSDDYLCGFSGLDVAMRAFRQAGGPSSDPVAHGARYWTTPRSFDILRHALQNETQGQARLNFIRTLHRTGVRTVWIVPLNGPAVAGYGVFNQFHTVEGAEPILPEHELIPFGLRVHAALRRNGVILRELNLTADDAGMALLLCRGCSATEMAARTGVTVRTIERRLNALRRRLRAKTTAEAIYKATAYGLL